MALRCSARLSENRTPSTGHTSRTRRGLSVLPFAEVLRACGKGIILDRTSHTRIPIAGTGRLYRSIRPAQSSLPDLVRAAGAGRDYRGMSWFLLLYRFWFPRECCLFQILWAIPGRIAGFGVIPTEITLCKWIAHGSFSRAFLITSAALSSLEPPWAFPSPHNSSARQEMIKTVIPSINMTVISSNPARAIGKRAYQ